jgi:hypothetical protein
MTDTRTTAAALVARSHCVASVRLPLFLLRPDRAMTM